MDNEQQPTSTPPTAPAPKGYGKRPAWQWVVIYLVVAAVVYGLVYYLFLRGDSSSIY